jgi:hypothetical protein
MMMMTMMGWMEMGIAVGIGIGVPRLRGIQN